MRSLFTSPIQKIVMLVTMLYDGGKGELTFNVDWIIAFKSLLSLQHLQKTHFPQLQCLVQCSPGGSNVFALWFVATLIKWLSAVSNTSEW